VQSVLFTGRTRHTILGDFSCPHRHGSPQPCSILCVSWSGLIFIRRSVIATFVAPDSSLVAWLGRGAFSGTLPHHLHRIGNRNGGIEGWPAVRPRHVEHNPGIGLIRGVPVAIIAIVVVITIVLELLGGVIFDFDVRVYRRIFTRLDEMVREMEELRA